MDWMICCAHAASQGWMASVAKSCEIEFELQGIHVVVKLQLRGLHEMFCVTLVDV
jgi:hypothetical protein